MDQGIDKETALREALKRLRLAAMLVGHREAKRLLDELAVEARNQREYATKTGGWS